MARKNNFLLGFGERLTASVGAGLVLTGLVFGLTFWLGSERRRHSIAERDPRQ
jgi:hypothetical protein